MKKTILFLFCISAAFTVFAQEPVCEDAPVWCDLSVELEGFSDTMPESDSPGGPDPLCPGGGTAHNTSWFGFVAGSTSISFDIELSDCSTVGAFSGVQAGVYSDCDYTSSPWCMSACENDDFSVTLAPLTVGDTYYFFLDGCAGSVCTYTVVNVVGGQYAEIDETGFSDPSCDDSSCDAICVGADDYSFTFTGSTLSIEYTWTIDPVPAGEPGTIVVDNGDTNVEMNFPEAGTFEICVTGYNFCDYTEEYCQIVDVILIADEDYGIVEVCENEYDVPDDAINTNGDDISAINPNGDIDTDGWQGGDVGDPGIDPGMTYTETYEVDDGWGLGCEYEQTLTILELDVPAPREIFAAICPGGSFSAGGMTFFTAQDEEEYLSSPEAINGCDSTIILTLYETEIDINLETGWCTEFGVELFADIDVNILPNDPGTSISSWDWYYSSTGVSGWTLIPGTTNLSDTYADQNGYYQVQFVSSLLGVDCALTTDILFVDLSGFAPYVLPDDIWVNVCENEEIVVYTLDIDDYEYPDDLVYTWTYPSDVSILSGDGTEEITIDWIGSAGGDLCFQVSNFCGSTPLLCQPIEIIANPIPEILEVAEVCIGETIDIFTDNWNNNYISLDWDLDGGTVSVGSDNTPNLTGVSWSTGGLKEIEIEIDYGCEDEVEHSIFVNVKEDPPFPTLNCSGSGGNLVIDWDDIPGVEDYDVTFITGSGGNFDGSQYVFPGLSEGDIVEIMITGTGSTLCGDIISSTIMCEVPNCPAADIVLTTDVDPVICLDGSETGGLFMGSDMNGNTGTGMYSGIGVDPITGMFDPSGLNDTTFNIKYTYSFGDGLCSDFAELPITLVEPPNFNLTADIIRVCVNENVNILLEGYTGGLNPTFDYGTAGVFSSVSTFEKIVYWNIPGIYRIQATVEIPGCGPITEFVEVTVEDLPEINIECQTSTNSITWNWNDEAEFDSYELMINGDSITTVTSGTFSITGLNPDSTITLEILGISNNSCTALSISEICTANNCAPVVLEIDVPDNQLIYCLQAPYDVIQLNANFDATGLTGSQFVDWSGATGVNPTTGLFDPNVEGPGTYTITAELVDMNCSYYEDVTLIIEEVPTLNLEGSSVICVEDDWTLTYTGDNLGDFTFNWVDLPSGANISELGPHIIDFNVPNVYTINLEASTSNCSAEMATIMVEVVDSTRTPQVQCTPGVDRILLDWVVGNSDCNGEFTILVGGNVETVTSDLTYTILNLDSEESFEIEIINENGDCICPPKSVIIDCMTLPCPNTTVDISLPDTTICSVNGQFDPLQLNPDYDLSLFSGFEQVSWAGSGIDATTGLFDANVLGPGSYTLSMDVTDGICSFDASIVVGVELVPDLLLQAEDSVCIEDMWMISYTGDDLSNYSINWDSDNGPVSDVTQDLEVKFETPGLYTYTMNANSSFCNATPFDVSVTVLDSISTPQVSCTAYVDSIVFTWDINPSDCNGDFVVLASMPEFPLLLETGSFTWNSLPDTEVTFTFQNSNACSCYDKSQTITCSTLPCPNFDVSIDAPAAIYCLDDNLQSISLTPLLNGNTIPDGIVWTGTNIGQDGIITIDENILPGVVYDYSLLYTEGKCAGNAVTSIQFFEPTPIDFEVVHPACVDETNGYVTLTGVIDSEDTNYYLDGTLIDPMEEMVLPIGDYMISVETGTVCNTEEMVTVNPPEVADFEIIGLMEGDLVKLNTPLSFYIESDPFAPDSLVWTYNDTMIIDDIVNLSFTENGTLCVEIYFNGFCSTELCQDIELEPATVFIPNVVSPIDGKNSEFTIFSNDVIENVNSMQIFDRWGNKVFEVEDRLPNSEDLIWRCEYQGKLVAQGVYVYVIEVKMFGQERPRVFAGDVTVIR